MRQLALIPIYDLLLVSNYNHLFISHRLTVIGSWKSRQPFSLSQNFRTPTHTYNTVQFFLQLNNFFPQSEGRIPQNQVDYN